MDTKTVTAANAMLLRIRQRMFHARSSEVNGLELTCVMPPVAQPTLKQRFSFQARISEFLLVTRLRARRRSAPDADVLERAAHILHVTCQNWFPVANTKSPRSRTRL